MQSDEIQAAFNHWADQAFAEYAEPCAAYCFNLYEHAEEWAIQLSGTVRFDPADPDWACEEAFSSGEDLFVLPRGGEALDWMIALERARSLVGSYLQTSVYASRFRATQAVAIGFVDGDLEILSVRGETETGT